MKMITDFSKNKETIEYYKRYILLFENRFTKTTIARAINLHPTILHLALNNKVDSKGRSVSIPKKCADGLVQYFAEMGMTFEMIRTTVDKYASDSGRQ